VLCQFPSQGEAPIAIGQLRSGTATGVGVAPASDGTGRGALRISGVFSFDGRLDLAPPGAKVTIIDGLDGGRNGGELVPGSRLTLAADGRNTATTGRFKTARGQTPTVEVTIGSRGRGQFNFRLDVSRGTVDVPPACPQPGLTTSIKIDDGTNPPLVVSVTQPWECLKRGTKVEYLRAP
jgi:hypothetical protein